MIAFGSPILHPDVFERCAEPGIKLAAEADSAILPYRVGGSTARSYNTLFEQAGQLEDLEALVVVHEDAEIVDPDLCAKVRKVLADDEVGVIGAIGAKGVRTIAWWEGAVTWASFIHRYSERGGGDLPGFAWNAAERPPYAETGEVDVVDGFLMVFSPWVVRNLSFDEALGKLHGYDVDMCLQAREAGKKVVTAELRAIHHHSLDLVGDPDGWVETHMTMARKWEGRLPGAGYAGDDWEDRARRAEAVAELARAEARTAQLKHEVREREVSESLSWRITRPLRWVNAWRGAVAKARRGRRPEPGALRPLKPPQR